MRARVIKHPVDGVPVKGIVELVDNTANRLLVTAGIIEPLEALPPRPPPKAPKAPSKSDTRDLDRMRAEFSEAWEGAQRELAETRAALADVTAERDELAAKLARVADVAHDEADPPAKPSKKQKAEG